MSYRIRTPWTASNGKPYWVKVDSSDGYGGFNCTEVLEEATVFGTASDAYAAIAKRCKHYGPVDKFSVVPYFDLPKVETSFGREKTRDQKGFLFIGGPADGQRIVVPDSISSTYYVPFLAPWERGITLSETQAQISTGRAVYLRLNVGSAELLAGMKWQGPQYTIYVFSHVEGLTPDFGATITFEGRPWRFERIDWELNSAHFIARSGTYQHDPRMGGVFSDLTYVWDLEAWTLKKGAVVYIYEKRVVVAP